MIPTTERQKQIRRYKNLIRDYPCSDRKKHWMALLKALESEE